MWIFIITLAFIRGSFITMYVIDKTVAPNIKKQIEIPRNNILKMEQWKKFQLDDYTRNEVIPSILELFEGLKEGKEIQEYVKTHTAPYKYPRIVEFRKSLPKTTSGKIMRNML